MKHRHIYLIFSRTGTWLSTVLTFFSEIKYVHSSISFDDQFHIMYSFGRRNPNNPFSGGLAEENLYGGVYKKFVKSECVIYRLKVSEEQHNALILEIESFLREKNKYRYNFLGLFGLLLNKPIKRSNHYFCSQFVSEVLIKSNIYSSHKSPELIKPIDLLLIENMELVYEGPINQYDHLHDLCSAI